MKKFLLIFALLFPVVASAQQLPASGGRTQGMPDGYGDLVQVNCKTGCSASGPSSSQLPATLGPKTGAASLSVVPSTDTPFSVLGTKLNDGTQSSAGGTHLTMGGIDTGTNVYRPLLVDSTGRASVVGTQFPSSLGGKTGATSLSVVPNTDTAFPASQSGTWTVQPGNTANTTAWKVDGSAVTQPISQATASNLNAQVVGSTAAGATYAGKPLNTGCYGSSTAPTAVTNGQMQNDWCFLNGQRPITLVSSGGTIFTSPSDATDGQTAGNIALLTTARCTVYNGTTWNLCRGDANGINTQLAATASRWQYAAATGGISNTTTAVTVCPAQGAGVRCYMTSLQLDATALGTATEVAVRDGASGTVIWRGYIGTAGVSNDNIVFPIPLKGTANTLMEVVTLTATVTGAVYLNAQGFSGN